MTQNTAHSEKLFAQAQELIPGGVNSPVRAFAGVGGTPRFIARGYGAFMEDVDGNKYIDYVMSWGPLLLGHAHPTVIEAISTSARNGTSFGAPTAIESELAQEILSRLPAMERIRFVSSGTEATMTAIRIARAHTKREKIVKMNGGYHGHSDALLCEAGSGLATFSLPGTAGVPKNATQDTIVINYNDTAALEQLFCEHGDEIAALIIEPIAANIGFIGPTPSFLAAVQKVCKNHGALLIFDEVITGFRVSTGGAQSLWNIEPDLSALGKIIGGGLPVGAVAGKKAIMNNLAPIGACYQAGTLSGNPLAMAAGLAMIKSITPELIAEVSRKTTKLISGFKAAAKKYQQPMQISMLGGLFGFYFLKEESATEEPIVDFISAKKWANAQKYARFFHFMLEKGHYFAPSAFEAAFMSSAHTDDQIELTIDCFAQFLANESTHAER